MKILFLLLLTLLIAPVVSGMKTTPKIPVPLMGKNKAQRFFYMASHNLSIGGDYCLNAYMALARNCKNCFESWIINLTTDVELGANKLDTLDDTGYTLLHQAVLNDKPPAISFLITNGANLKTPAREGQNYAGLTPIKLAIVYGKKECIKELLRNGAKEEGLWDLAHSHGIEVQKIYEQADQEVKRELAS